MDWLSQTNKYLSSDLELFSFCPSDPFQISTVVLTVNGERVDCKIEKLSSEQEYLDWIEECHAHLQQRPTILFVIHVKDNGMTKALPYSQETFELASKKMYQHRSLAFCMPRKSTTIFNSRRVDWEFTDSIEQSIVYNCRSDTETLARDDDILLSTTYFKNKPWTFSIMYGCPSSLAGELTSRLNRFKKSAFHPLMFPMIFVEYERKRFINSLETNGPQMKLRIMDLENRLEADKNHEKNHERNHEKNHEGNHEKNHVRYTNRIMTEKDCAGTRVWLDVSRLKIGMESFMKVVVCINEQQKTIRDLELRPTLNGTPQTIGDSASSENIACRLRELMAELDSKMRMCDGLLDGMALAIQVEWNYHTRRDATANIVIAHSSKKDSAQMKLISVVGMVFLPGTFLATLFSMSFFRWMPDDSPQIVSPWIAVYFGLTAITTATTFLFWYRWKGKDDLDPETFAYMLDNGYREKGLVSFDGSQQSRVSSDPINTAGIELRTNMHN